MAALVLPVVLSRTASKPVAVLFPPVVLISRPCAGSTAFNHSEWVNVAVKRLVVVDRNGAGQRAYNGAGVEIASAVEHSRAGSAGESPGATRHHVGPGAMVDAWRNRA